MSTTQTQNGAVVFQSSGNPIVDCFMSLVRGVSDETLKTYLHQCWNFDPYLTIALLFNTRDRANGKKEKNLGNRAMIWLRRNKFNTYKKNINKYIDLYGRWKDIVYIASKHNDNSFEIESIAQQLKKDKDELAKHNTKNISLCAKWAPSQQDKYDNSHNLAHNIADNLYPNDPKKMEKYRKTFLVPLRKQIKIVESYMTSNKWTEIQYDKIPAIASKKLRNAFQKHDPDGYNKYLKQVATGEKKIKVTGLLPHELVAYYLKNNVFQADETIELQWNELLRNVKEQGILKNMLAVIDVSGSMTDVFNNIQPIWVSIALGILIAKCCEGPFANKVITFHNKPSVFEIKGETLYEQVNYIKSNMDSGLNTNFEAIFDLLLNIGNMFSVPSHLMPDKIVVLSDMKFDAASNSSNIKEETLHTTIMNKYKHTTYSPPKLIYWNLSSNHDALFPVKAVTDNVAMISGFSEQLLKVFMNNDNFNAEKIVYEILEAYRLNVEIDENDI